MPRHLSQHFPFKLVSLLLSYIIKIMCFARTQNESVTDVSILMVSIWIGYGTIAVTDSIMS